MTPLARLTESLRAACALVVGVSQVAADDPSTITVQYNGDPSAEQRQAVAAVLAAFDWSDDAQAAWEKSRARASALAGLLTRSDDTAVGVRMVVIAVCDLFNQRLRRLGESPILLPEIVGYIQANPTLGDAIQA